MGFFVYLKYRPEQGLKFYQRPNILIVTCILSPILIGYFLYKNVFLVIFHVFFFNKISPNSYGFWDKTDRKWPTPKMISFYVRFVCSIFPLKTNLLESNPQICCSFYRFGSERTECLYVNVWTIDIGPYVKWKFLSQNLFSKFLITIFLSI